MTLDAIVFALYALAMLLLGWLGSRRSKTREDFLVAGRRLGPSMYMSTMAATVLGGASTIGTVRLGYVHGISGVWLCGAIGLGVILLNLFLARPLMNLRILTVTQILERRYNPVTRQVSAAIMFIYALMISVVSILGISTVMQVFFDLPLFVSVAISGSLVLIYSAIGGMWAVTFTDLVQFIIKTCGLMLLLLPLSLTKVGGWDALVAKLPPTAISITALGTDTIVTYIFMYTFGILIGQDIWQRVFTARTPAVARYAGTGAGVYCIVYGLVAAVIGMCARVLIPDLQDANTAFASMIRIALPDGIRSLVITAAMAAMMSTASAGLLAASSTLTEDLLPKLRGRPSNLRINRLGTLFSGIIVVVVALVVDDVLSGLMLAYNILVGGMLIPLIGAVYWSRATTTGATVSMVLGALTAAVCMAVDGIDSNTPIHYSLLVATVSYVLVSLLSQQRATAATDAIERPKPENASAPDGQLETGA